MPTVINNPGNTSGSGSSGGAGVVIGAVLVIIILVIVVVLSLPYIKRKIDAATRPGNSTINVQLPTPQIPSDSTSTK